MGVSEKISVAREGLKYSARAQYNPISKVGMDAVKVPMQSQPSRVSLKEQASKSKPLDESQGDAKGSKPQRPTRLVRTSAIKV